MKLEDALKLIEELKQLFEQLSWSPNDWSARIPRLELKRLELLADFAKNYSPSSAEEIRRKMARIHQLFVENEGIVNLFHKKRKSLYEANGEFFHLLNDELFDLTTRQMNCQEELRYEVLEFLDIISSILT